MKKVSIALILILVVVQSATAQKFYLKAGTGYAIPMLGQKVDRYGNYYNGFTVVNGGLGHYELKNASFSSGVLGIIGGGYMFADNIGVELAANINVTSDMQLMYGAAGYSNLYISATTKKAGHTLILTPSLIMQTSYAKVNGYTRLGLALPLNVKVTQVDSAYGYSNSGAFYEDHFSWKLKHYFSLGFTAAAGLKVNLKKHISIWAEANMLYLALSPREKVLDYAIIGGRTLEPSEISNTPTRYEFSKTGITTEPPQPFSNLSASVGISYQLKAKKKTQKS